jgi:hypothetical protein
MLLRAFLSLVRSVKLVRTEQQLDAGISSARMAGHIEEGKIHTWFKQTSLAYDLIWDTKTGRTFGRCHT